MSRPLSLTCFSVFALLIVAMISGCAGSGPRTKEDYLERFTAFVDEIEQSAQRDQPDFWKRQLVIYEDYTGKWHQKFSDEFTWRERLTIAQLQLHFRMMHGTFVAAPMAAKVRQNLLEIRDQAKHYIENEMSSDVERLIEQATAAGQRLQSELEGATRPGGGENNPPAAPAP